MPLKRSTGLALLQNGNHLAHLAHAFVTSELNLKGDIAAHSFFVPLLFPFINHPLGDELVFLALYYLHIFSQGKNAVQSASSLGKVPGSLLFIIALLNAFEWEESYLISPDIQTLRTGIFRFLHSRPELNQAIDAFANPDHKVTLGGKIKGALIPYPRKKPSPCVSDTSSRHHSLSAPRIKDASPPEYEVQNRLVAPQEPLEYCDVATLISPELGCSRHTVPALEYEETWSSGMLKLKAYQRGQVLDRMRDDFDGVVSQAEPTDGILKGFKAELMRRYC